MNNLQRIKLYFPNLDNNDLVEFLEKNNLNPNQDYDKSVHRIAMLECVVDVLTDLSQKSNTRSYQIEYYQKTIAVLKANQGEKHL